MATSQLTRIVDFARDAERRTNSLTASDAQLLDAFLAAGDETAFAELVRRHGPMVLSVCRRVLRNAADADDAFQAVFLVLVRKAASIRPREMVGNWLYGVALRTACKVKSMIERRIMRPLDSSAPAAPLFGDRELAGAIDRELSRLPDHYRLPIIVCDRVAGCRFVERVLTVVQTLRLQKQPVMDFLHRSLLARRHGQAAPQLLPTG